jgi:hypothetical protein
MATVSLPHKLYHYTPAIRGKYGLWFYLAISPRSATIQKQKNRLDKVSLISKKI